jgi:hypothetical protein
VRGALSFDIAPPMRVSAAPRAASGASPRPNGCTFVCMQPQGSGPPGWSSLHRELCESSQLYDWCVGIVKLGAGGIIVIGIMLAARWHPLPFGARDSLIALLYGYGSGLVAGLLGCGSEMLGSRLDAKRLHRWGGIASGAAGVVTLVACICMVVTLLLSVALAIAFGKGAPSPF